MNFTSISENKRKLSMLNDIQEKKKKKLKERSPTIHMSQEEKKTNHLYHQPIKKNIIDKKKRHLTWNNIFYSSLIDKNYENLKKKINQENNLIKINLSKIQKNNILGKYFFLGYKKNFLKSTRNTKKII